MKTKLYQQIARKLEAIESCHKHNNTEWENRHYDSVLSLVNDYMPSGSGIDVGTKIDMAASHPNKLVFTFEYHHMNGNGYYDGWTEHKAIVTPSLGFDINIKITGPNRNDVKEYLYQVFEYALNQEV